VIHQKDIEDKTEWIQAPEDSDILYSPRPINKKGFKDRLSALLPEEVARQIFSEVNNRRWSFPMDSTTRELLRDRISRILTKEMMADGGRNFDWNTSEITETQSRAIEEFIESRGVEEINIHSIVGNAFCYLYYKSTPFSITCAFESCDSLADKAGLLLDYPNHAYNDASNNVLWDSLTRISPLFPKEPLPGLDWEEFERLLSLDDWVNKEKIITLHEVWKTVFKVLFNKNVSAVGGRNMRLISDN